MPSTARSEGGRSAVDDDRVLTRQREASWQPETPASGPDAESGWSPGRSSPRREAVDPGSAISVSGTLLEPDVRSTGWERGRDDGQRRSILIGRGSGSTETGKPVRSSSLEKSSAPVCHRARRRRNSRQMRTSVIGSDSPMERHPDPRRPAGHVLEKPSPGGARTPPRRAGRAGRAVDTQQFPAPCRSETAKTRTYACTRHSRHDAKR